MRVRVTGGISRPSSLIATRHTEPARRQPNPHPHHLIAKLAQFSKTLGRVEPMTHDIVVHVWSDIACPWCWIGKQRLEQGIAQSGKRVAVEYHSYQLYPEAPSDPTGNYVESLAAAKQTRKRDVLPTVEQAADVARAEGLELNWEQIQHVGTFLAHQLVYAAKAQGSTPEEAAELGGKAFERLYRAHFSEGLNVADSDTLLKLAEDLGLDVERAEAELESGEHTNAVRSDVRDARSLGITGVPFFVVGGKFGISGAQPPDVYAETINRALAEIQYAQAQEVPIEAPVLTANDDAGLDTGVVNGAADRSDGEG